MDAIWYCVIHGERRGPMNWDLLAELARSRELAPADLVWQPAFGATWQSAASVPGLFAGVPQAWLMPQADYSPAAARPLARDTPLAGVVGERPAFWAAVSESWDAMVAILFKPFDLTRWFSIGFCAWIAAIGAGGCNGTSFMDKGTLQSVQSGGQETATRFSAMGADLLSKVHGLQEALGGMLLILIVATAVVVLVWLLVSCWLRSRGAFMLVHRWHEPSDSIKQAWAAGREIGRSLFFWRVCFGIIMLILFGGMATAMVMTVAVPFFQTGALPVGGEIWLLGLGGMLLLVLLLWSSTGVLLDAFVVPVMYWRRVGVLDGWRVTLAFCNQQPLAILIFLALRPLLLLAGGLVGLALMLSTCCLILLPMLLPYLNQVVLLPWSLFFRGLGICFIKQWRPDL